MSFDRPTHPNRYNSETDDEVFARMQQIVVDDLHDDDSPNVIPEGRSQKVVAGSQAQEEIKIKLLHLDPDRLLQQVHFWKAGVDVGLDRSSALDPGDRAASSNLGG